MASEASQSHFLLLPFLAPGHMIPMFDTARLLAQRGAIVTIVTTPVNAARFKTVHARAIDSGMQIRLIEIQFPWQQAGLPEGCENCDLLPTTDFARFLNSLHMLQLPFENLFERQTLKPCCIISDMCFPWTVDTAAKFNVPRIIFHEFSCFCLFCLHLLGVSKDDDFKELQEQIFAADKKTYGTIINTFEELESPCIEDYKKAKQEKVWCIGPVSLCNKEPIDKAERGKKASIDVPECLTWLDSQQPTSVVYVCLGSICNLPSSQLIELGLGLEASNKPFVWVIRGESKLEELEKWLVEENFKERIKGRGLLIRGWAPQVLILSHPAVGGFLTHCGWNSSLEGISAGVQMLTWPLFADQFCNEKLIVEVLRIGVSVGVEVPMKFGEEEKIGVLVKKEDVETAINILMDDGQERDARRRRAEEFGELAKRALDEGGSSYNNIELFMQDISFHGQPQK
ncbi:UDP-glycosyltransferase 73C6-like [Citrus sinensis]|uniref:UDP-glycosyltransferase 73C6-like n=1 Tax=Citrus sinensis TaxID=2711 RepID=UPI000CED187C|nr:UDP-glycosyltransferase 73C6-like [Citrus sinensis]XP_024034143.1 UDP-glycosyltransferase 73C6 [Citrus x clementina]